MRSRYVMSVLVLASLMLGGNAQAVNYVQPEITGSEVSNYADKAPQFVPVQTESKANLVQYKMKDTGGKLELEQENIKVEIPKNIAEPVVLKGKDKKASDIKITMPQAKGSKVTKEKNGVVGYESKDNYTNLVEPTKDGIRLLTVIENKNAPERYEYKLDIKGGYVLTESFGENGKKGIAVLNKDQSDIIAMIDVPWAKDGSGKDIETYYEIKGQTIVQVVKHKVKGTVYPVTADPYIWGLYYENISGGKRVWLNKSQTANFVTGGAMTGLVLALVPGGLPAGTGLGFFITLANDAQSRGNCIGFNMSYKKMYMFPWNNQHCIW